LAFCFLVWPSGPFAFKGERFTNISAPRRSDVAFVRIGINSGEGKTMEEFRSSLKD
jgi:hypothetical protein